MPCGRADETIHTVRSPGKMSERNKDELLMKAKLTRLWSFLLALVMLLSLMPGLELHAHAFWDDYDTGGDCPNCDHYHWAENCCDCQFCTIDCNYECWVETHCNGSAKI